MSVTKKKQPVHVEVSVEESDSELSQVSEQGEFSEEIDDDFENDEGAEDVEDAEEESKRQQGALSPEDSEKRRIVNIESRHAAKKLKIERQGHRPHAETVVAAKKVWEMARRRDLKPEARARPLQELLALLKGKYKELILKHDASRMVQTCVKYGSTEDRLSIAQELQGSFVNITKSKYGKYIVRRLLQFCPSMRRIIASEFQGQVVKSLRHVDASSVMEALYSEYMNAKEKNALLLEFYGPEYELLQKSRKYQKQETDLAAVPLLSEIVTKGAEKRISAMKYLREAIDNLTNKNLFQHSLIHRLMLEYVTYESVNKVQDWIGTFEDKFVEILHTFEGARVVCRCLAAATSKQRKSLIKTFKPFVGKIYREEYGHQVLLAAFSLVDDTVLLRSNLISEMLKEGLDVLLADKYAAKILLFVMAFQGDFNGVRHILTAPTVELLKACDAVATAAGTSKKEPLNRANELRAEVVNAIVQFFTAEKTLSILMSSADESSSLLIEASLTCESVFSVLLSVITEKVFESPDARGLLKKLARRLSCSQAEMFYGAVYKTSDANFESEAVYVLLALLTANPELKKEIPMKKLAKSNSLHVKSLLEKLGN